MASLRCLEGKTSMWLRFSGFQNDKTATERHEEIYVFCFKIQYILLSKVRHILNFCGGKEVPASGVTYSEFNMDIVPDPSRLCCMYTGRRGE